ncbi:MAG: penicillin-binding protein [Candidatus Melainabacteria bacterium HGW-Melainabacteria-1]|nr:MAG: penicillin-binding protein [Candidatus Melainabacteria bacterium HGW-Melainabacteria-1]
MQLETPLQSPRSDDKLHLGRFLFILLLKGMLLLLLLALASAGGFAMAAWMRVGNLPDVRKLAYYDPHERSEIVAPDGQVLAQVFGEENRKVVKLAELPGHVSDAILAIEDSRFREHSGIDPIGILRAFKANLDSDETVQGGSTITQQVVKNLFLTNERTYARKAAEAVLSIQLDQIFLKPQILELYTNLIYFGHNAYGIQAAAETYFGKDAKDLNLSESAMIAGLIRGPERFSPYNNYALSKTRQALVLDSMAEADLITLEQAQAAKQEPLRLYGIRRGMKHPYFTTYVMDVLRQHYTETELETGGLRIVTTLNPRLQEAAERLLPEHVASLKPYRVNQGALVTVEAPTGYVRAMVGGTRFGYGKNEFNRAFQAQRQTGSAFKPFVYAAAFENGMTPSSVEVDSPVSYPDGVGKHWSPQNYGRSFSGSMTFKQALMKSVNVVAVKVMDCVGIAKVIDMTKRLGIQSEVRPYLSSALGASEITPLEMAQAYSAFANDGVLVQASPIFRIENKQGEVIFKNPQPRSRRVIGKDVARAMNHTLRAVVDAGTGYAARIPEHQVAGKTGTTSAHKDAWFIGYTPRYVTAVWVGNDLNQRMLGATGGGFCAPLWQSYMATVLKPIPPQPFPPEIPLKQKPRQMSALTANLPRR